MREGLVRHIHIHIYCTHHTHTRRVSLISFIAIKSTVVKDRALTSAIAKTRDRRAPGSFYRRKHLLSEPDVSLLCYTKYLYTHAVIAFL